MSVGRVNFGPVSRPPQLQDEAARFTSTDHPALAQTLVRELQKTREERVRMLVKSPAKDYAEYQNRCGVIEGLDIAIAVAAQIDQKLKA